MIYKSNEKLREDNIYVEASIQSLKELTNLPTVSSKSRVVVSNGRIVNCVSDNYGFLPNEKFYTAIEEKLINADINFKIRSINKDDRQFKVDYILVDDKNQDNFIGTENDKILPMMSFTNSYDGSCKTLGTFALYRMVCQNGLHVAESQVGFAMKHRSNHLDVVLPEIDILIEKFKSTEYYKIKQQFQKLSEISFSQVDAFVADVCNKTNIFNFFTSEKNLTPSQRAQEVMNIIDLEKNNLKVRPNLWIGYNAFNEVIHKMNHRNFEVAAKKDLEVYEYILQGIN